MHDDSRTRSITKPTISAQYTEKERSGVNRTIETALARLADPEREDAFYTDAGGQANL